LDVSFRGARVLGVTQNLFEESLEDYFVAGVFLVVAVDEGVFEGVKLDQLIV